MDTKPVRRCRNVGSGLSAEPRKLGPVLVPASFKSWDRGHAFIEKPCKALGWSRRLKPLSKFLYLSDFVCRQGPRRLRKLSMARCLRAERIPNLVSRWGV